MGTVLPYLQPAKQRQRGHLSDHHLLLGIADGDVELLGELYDRYHGDVYGYLCGARAVYGADLDDLVHDTFVAVVDAARRYSGRSSIKTWLFGIAINVSRNHVRSEVRRRKAMDGIPANTERPVRPDERAQSKEQLSRLADCVSELPHHLRAAYTSCVVEGLPHDEAATILRARKGTLWRRVHEARQLLRRCIGRSQQ